MVAYKRRKVEMEEKGVGSSGARSYFRLRRQGKQARRLALLQFYHNSKFREP